MKEKKKESRMYTAAEEYFNSSRTAWPPRYIYKSNKKTKMKKNYLAVIRARVYGPTRTFDDDDDDDASPAARPPGVISVFRSLAPVQKSFFFTLSCRRHPAIFFFFSPPYEYAILLLLFRRLLFLSVFPHVSVVAVSPPCTE